jgi:iron-sulfur cluster repair protein YtfE (RIC family)
MTQDHREVDSIFERADAAAKAEDHAALAREAGEFLRRIAVHIEIEERLLFPIFEERTGMIEAGPSVTMREEHRQMEARFAEMRGAIDARDAGGYRRAAASMMDILLQHNQKEEQMMYPMIDDILGSEVAALLDAARAMASA